MKINLSPALVPFEYEYKPGLYLGASSFNPAWVYELGLKPEGLILDIGSYDGGDAVRLKKELPECDIFSCEIDQDRFDKIISNIYEEGIYFFNCGISDCNKVNDYYYKSVCNLKDAGSMHSPGETGGQCSYFKHTDFYKKTYQHIRQTDRIWCTSRRLDFLISDSYSLNSLKYINGTGFMKNNILLAHIDVEGAELNVLKGMGNLRPKLIYIETLEGMFEGAATKEEIHGYLTSINYTLIKDCISDRLYLYNN